MRVPLVYPKIPGPMECPLKKIVAFEKYDGTNIHWKWDVDFGWVSFGTRRDQYDYGDKNFALDHPGLEEVFDLFHNEYSEKIARRLKNKSCREIMLFTEFFGKESFAGNHEPDDPKCFKIFDCQFDGDMLPPEEFIQEMKTLPTARVVHQGKYSYQFIEDVRAGNYKVGEGVVCKGIIDQKVYMTKIKTNKYQHKLQSKFNNKWKDHWE